MKRKYSRPRLFTDRLKEDLKDPKFRQAYEEEAFKTDIAVQVAILRQKAGLTQSDLAKKIGVTQQVVARIENPDKSNMTVSTLRKVASALGKKLDINIH